MIGYNTTCNALALLWNTYTMNPGLLYPYSVKFGLRGVHTSAGPLEWKSGSATRSTAGMQMITSFINFSNLINVDHKNLINC